MLHAQRFIEMMNDPNADFYEVKKEAEEYFKIHGTGKGMGYKVYKRWEHEKLLTRNSDGKFMSQDQLWQEYEKIKTQRKAAPKNAKVGNVYRELGPRGYTITSHYSPGMGRMTSICVDPQTATTIYAAGVGGVWKTTNNGTSWNPLTDHLPNVYSNAVAVQPGNSNLVIIGIRDHGILKSTNGGASFQASNIGNGNPTKIIFHPTNPSIVLVAADNGIYYSNNAGTSFVQVNANFVTDIDFKPGDPSIVYACGRAFFRSINGGNSFTQITAGINTFDRSFLAVTPANPNYVYVVQARGSGLGYIYRSNNSGVSFETRLNANPTQGTNYFNYNVFQEGGQAWYDMAITASPTDAETLIIGGINLWKSTNGGTSFFQQTDWLWNNSFGYVHADIHALEWINGTVYCGSDGGIFRSTNGGDDWSNISMGIGNREFYRIGGIESDPYYIGGGSQDNGQSLLLTNNVNNWREWAGADGMEVVIDYNNKNNIYGCLQFGGTWKSTDGGMSFNGLTMPSSGAWITPLLMDPVNSSTIYAAFEDMWKSTNGGNSWTKISSVGDGFSDMEAAAIAPSNNQILYMGRQNRIWVTRNGGTSWTEISTGIYGYLNYISVHPNDPNRVTVSTGDAVFTSTNGGQNWTNINYNLPALPKRCVLHQRSPEDIIYVGLQVGVFYLRPGTTTWVEYFDGLPNVPVSEMEINYSIGQLRVATSGRGLWEAPIIQSPNLRPSVAITSPANGASFNAPATVNISANASDADGTISKVEFFAGATKIGEDLTAPYSLNWNNVSAGSYALTAVATDNRNANTTSASVNITVSAIQNQLPFSGAPAAIPGTIKASDYDLGGEGIAFHDLSAGNAGGQYRTDGVDLEACSEGGFNVGWIETGEWLEYTVQITQTATYTASVRLSSPNQGGTLSISLNGNTLANAVAVPQTGGWQNWQSVSIPNLNLSQGSGVLRISMNSNAFNISSIQFSLNSPVQSPFGGVVKSIPGRIEAEEYDLGGPDIAYNDLSAGNAGNTFRTDAVDIENCSEGGYNVGWVSPGEWLEYTVQVAATGTYALQLRVAALANDRQVQVLADGQAITGIVSIPATGWWQNWQTVNVPSVYLTAGQKILRVNFLNNDVNINYLQFVSGAVAQKVENTSEEEEENSSFNLYPNPVTEKLHINGNAYESAMVEIQVLNTVGKILMTETIPSQQNTYAHVISCKDLSSGVYYLKVNSGGIIRIEKFIKQ
jgi:hypothetical protein